MYKREFEGVCGDGMAFLIDNCKKRNFMALIVLGMHDRSIVSSIVKIHDILLRSLRAREGLC